MSGETDADDAALLDSLLATLDGDSDGDAIAQLSALVDSSGVGVGVGVRSPTSGCLLSAVDSLDLVFESDGDALLDLFSPPLEFDSHAPTDAIATRNDVAADLLRDNFDGSGATPPPTTLVTWTALATDDKIAVASSTAEAMCDQNRKGVVNFTTPVKRKASKKDPNKARKERAKELQGLRREVEDLTDRVEALRALDDRTERRLSVESTTQSDTAFTALTGAPPLWGAICRDQLARRVRTERENVRLKRALDEQVNITKGLQRLIEKSNKAQVCQVHTSSFRAAGWCERTHESLSECRKPSTVWMCAPPDGCIRSPQTRTQTLRCSTGLLPRWTHHTLRRTVCSSSTESTSLATNHDVVATCEMASMGGSWTCFPVISCHSMSSRRPMSSGSSTVVRTSTAALCITRQQRFVSTVYASSRLQTFVSQVSIAYVF
jgi:Skp family chaperone for outer membrane proteins